MRISSFLAVPLAISMVSLPARSSAQVSVSVKFGTRLGPDVGVFAYAPERMGAWRANYRRWTPVTLYDVNGHYYRTAVRGARPVMVYSYNDQYFFPPTDRAWIGLDKRYNYNRAPIAVDVGRARPYAPVVAVAPGFGLELGVVGYSADRAGDWRTNYKRWTPVTLYELNGRYYPHSGPGARAVQLYRYQDEYFLPPPDRGWVGFDRRFDYKHAPTDDDRRRVRERP